MNLHNVSEIGITYKNHVKNSERVKIRESSEAVRVFMPLFAEILEHRESMYSLYLNRSNQVLGIYQIGLGGTSGVVADVKLIFQGALKTNASGVILAHNHPSGNTMPSQPDIDLTRKVKQAGLCLDILLLDHLIITPDNRYYSFADEGLL